MKQINELTSIISNLSTFCLFLLAVWALIFKRNEIFKNNLTNKQIDELLSLRDKLNRIVYDSFDTKFWADNIKSLNRSLLDFQREQPENFKQYRKMQDDLIWLVRMIEMESFHLFPKDFDQQILKEYGDFLKENIQPFTILKFSDLQINEIEKFQNKTIKLIKYIEKYTNKLSQ
jgi:hypothetical protein